MECRESVGLLLKYCDGAVSVDGMGYNKFDTTFARDLMKRERWTYNQEQAAYKMLKKYSKQLLSHGIKYDEIKLVVSKSEEGNNPFSGKLVLDYKPKEGKFYLYTRKGNNLDLELKDEIPSPRWIQSERAWRYLNNKETKERIIKEWSKFELVTPEAEKEIQDFKKWTDNKSKQDDEKLSLINQSTEIKKGNIHTDMDMPIKSIPYHHQKVAFDVGMTLPSSALFMEQGTGKTLSAIAVLGMRYKLGQIKKALIIAPLSVLSEWKRQFDEHSDFPYQVEVLTSKRKRKSGIPEFEPERLHVIVTNYETVWKREKSNKDCESKKRKGANPDDIIRQWYPDFIILDESQKIKSKRTKQSSAIIKLGKRKIYKMILTGTPISQNPLDIVSQYQFLDKTIFGTHFGKVRDRYAVMGGYYNKEIIGLRIIPTIPGTNKPNPYYDPELEKEFMEKLNSISYRVTKSEALDLPEETDQFLYTQLENSTLSIYNQMVKKSILEIDGGYITAPIVLTQILRLQQITGGFLKDEENGKIINVGNEKLSLLEETLSDLIEKGKKVVIFAMFRPEIKAISDIITKMGISHRVLTGDTEQSERELYISDFQNKKEVKVFVSQIRTGGVGITLTSADTSIFYSLGYSLNDYLQAKARLHRIGQKNKVTHIHLIVEDRIDEGIIRVLREKKDVSKMVVDDLKNLFLGGSKMARVIGKAANEAVENSPRYPDEKFERDLKELISEIEEELGKHSKNPVPIEEQQPDGGKGSRKGRIKRNKRNKSENNIRNTRKEKTGITGQIITVKELSIELGIDSKKIRKWLRANCEKGEGRWEWEPNDPVIEKIREVFSK
ncbi:MAG: DEAD/DEAH box helicase [Bacilli bacterium]